MTVYLYFREFVKNAWADIERFKEQKNRDLKEALISYAVMQISMCKKVASPGRMQLHSGMHVWGSSLISGVLHEAGMGSGELGVRSSSA